MTRRRRHYPSDDSVGLGVMARMRELVLNEIQLDRAVAALKNAEAIVATGAAAGSDMSAFAPLLAEKRDQIRRLEDVIAMREMAAGIDPRPPRDLGDEDHHP